MNEFVTKFAIKTEFGFVHAFSEYAEAHGGEHIAVYGTRDAAEQAARDAGWKAYTIEEMPTKPL